MTERSSKDLEPSKVLEFSARPIPHSWSSRKTALAPLFQPGKHIGLLPNEKKKVCYSAALASTNMLPVQTSRASVKTVSKPLSNVQA